MKRSPVCGSEVNISELSISEMWLLGTDLPKKFVVWELESEKIDYNRQYGANQQEPKHAVVHATVLEELRWSNEPPEYRIGGVAIS